MMDPTIMTAQAIAQAPCYFFNPEATKDGRQHGPFYLGMQQMTYPTVPTLPSTPMYSRPSSSGSQPSGQRLQSSARGSFSTPLPSPQLVSQKPIITVETEIKDDMYYPTTPPLSTSGSTVGSPSSCDILQTPMNPMLSGWDGSSGAKDPFDSASTFQSTLTGMDSPPLTPGKILSI
jgi:hypothetical protein